ncbi:maleate cis-trans isomerase [Cytobacillus suaedae]|nr:maleate cis-trans isomerase [Cytobacillus suaedae]
MVCNVEEGFSQKYGIDEYAIYDCKVINNWADDLTFYYNPTEGNVPNDYLATNLGWLIVSEKCRKILEEMNVTNIQYLPIRIKSLHDENEIQGFSVLNIIGEVEALNLNASVYNYFEVGEEKILSVIKYAVNKDLLLNTHIFRLKEDTIPVFVSEKVKKAIRLNKLSGFDFLEIKVV